MGGQNNPRAALEVAPERDEWTGSAGGVRGCCQVPGMGVHADTKLPLGARTLELSLGKEVLLRSGLLIR